MTWLVIGVLMWSAVHLLPSAGAPLRARAADRLGQVYQGVFALAILASVGLMVLGWRSTPPRGVYPPPAWGSGAANLLMAAVSTSQANRRILFGGESDSLLAAIRSYRDGSTGTSRSAHLSSIRAGFFETARPQDGREYSRPSPSQIR